MGRSPQSSSTRRWVSAGTLTRPSKEKSSRSTERTRGICLPTVAGPGGRLGSVCAGRDRRGLHHYRSRSGRGKENGRGSLEGRDSLQHQDGLRTGCRPCPGCHHRFPRNHRQNQRVPGAWAGSLSDLVRIVHSVVVPPDATASSSLLCVPSL